MASDIDLLKSIKEGDRLSASQWNLIVSLLQQLMRSDGPEFFVDSTGHKHRRLLEDFPILRGVLQQDFYAGSTTTGATPVMVTVCGLAGTVGLAAINKGIVVTDPLNIIPADPLSQTDGSGKAYIPAGTCVLAVRLSDGVSQALWQPFSFSNCCPGPTTTSTTTTSTTSTTPNPSANYSCQGTCKWTWDNSVLIWSLTTNSCGGTTSTTSTTAAPTTSTTTTSTTPGGTTTSTTSTTPYPPCCNTTSTSTTPSGTTTTSTTPSGTTTSSTTSTTSAPCNCQAPSYCGTTDGECTYTNCIQSTFNNPTLNCTGTTSTTTSTTPNPSISTTPCPTTTTPNPAASTTPPPCTNCTWIGEGPFPPILISNNCLAVNCLCPPPDPLPDGCSTVVMPCVTIPPTSTTAPPGCGGSCNWICIYSGSLSNNGGSWASNGVGSCSGGCNCQCPAPTTPCNLCDTMSTGCADNCGGPGGTGTSTTYNPCGPSTSSTTTTTSTSTTPNCQTSTCYWNTGGTNPNYYWHLIISNCPSYCPCQPPGGTPTNSCQTTTSGCCNNNNCTSTSTTNTTSTTTSTSTSTTPIPCLWQCSNPGGSTPTWAAITTCGILGNVCCPIQAVLDTPCTVSNIGATLFGGCGSPLNCLTTSTTPAPTTSTTTTSTSTTPPSCNNTGCTYTCSYDGSNYSWTTSNGDEETQGYCYYPGCPYCCTINPDGTTSQGVGILFPCDAGGVGLSYSFPCEMDNNCGQFGTTGSIGLKAPLWKDQDMKGSGSNEL